MLLNFEDKLLQSWLVDNGGKSDELIERTHRVDELVGTWSKQEDLTLTYAFFGFVVNTAHSLKLPFILQHNKLISEIFCLLNILVLFVGVWVDLCHQSINNINNQSLSIFVLYRFFKANLSLVEIIRVYLWIFETGFINFALHFLALFDESILFFSEVLGVLLVQPHFLFLLWQVLVKWIDLVHDFISFLRACTFMRDFFDIFNGNAGSKAVRVFWEFNIKHLLLLIFLLNFKLQKLDLVYQKYDLLRCQIIDFVICILNPKGR